MSDDKEKNVTNGEDAVKTTSSGETRGESSQQDSRPNSQSAATTTPALPLPQFSTFPPPRPSEVERRPGSSHMESMIREPLPSQHPDHSNEFFMAINRRCRAATNHAMGVFCLDCRGIPMPWGQNLPEVHDDRGNQVLRGGVGTVLAGVRLNSLNAIATLCTVAYLEVTRQPHTTVDGLANMESRYPASAEAGRRIARLWQTLRNLADDEDSVPHYYDIILRALMEPFLSENALGNSFLGGQTNRGSSSRQPGGGNARRRPDNQGLGGRQGQEALEASPTPTPQHQGSGRTATEEGSENESDEDESMDDDQDEEDKANSDEIMPSQERKSGFQFNRPAKRRPWEFVPGTDLSPAELGKPEPSKFFLIRQNKNNSMEKDIRQYPRWEKFDWNNKEHIDCLNRHRRQIKTRTSGITHEPRLPWTQMEHDVLKDLVDQAVQSGKHRLNIDWDEIARDMSKRFENIVQNPGQAMAQTTDLFDGRVQPAKGKANTLKSVRKGTPNRKGTAVKNQAEKFGDIYKMLVDSKPLANKGPKKKRPVEQLTDLENTDDDTASPSTKQARRKRIKRVDKGPKDMPDRGPKPPGPPPPPGGAGGISGPMGDGGWTAVNRTALPTR
ncbi:hypothetical protein N431DRAFT_485262 [Stipitochalara longipes BDJ]|nr:hypothetical protein N431DRAFT_485262 [Stipitochalara longipes BDJ]